MKCWAGRVNKLEIKIVGEILTSDMQMVSNGSKRSGTKEPLDEGEGGE